MATFVIGGLWHGAGWTFVFWGFLHGLALMVQRFWSKLGFKLWTWLAWLITFNFINVAWVFFRAKEWDDAVKVLGSMFSMDNIQFSEVIKMTNDGSDVINWIIFGFILILVFKNSIQRINNFQLNYKTTIFTSIIITISILSLSGESEFLYFRF
jgi:D-alanyl-lipoteichoic acid acyltransferase DltB (MBOAT superfamily)